MPYVMSDDEIREFVKIRLFNSRDIVGELEEPILFPGWDNKTNPTEGGRIKRAAQAILADGLTCDQGTETAPGDVGALLNYIGETLEV